MKYILIVDDDAFFASTFQNNFSWQNYNFATPIYAESGQKAIELLQQRDYEFAFVDMSMPSMSGPQLIEYIHEYYPKINCISLSNYDDFNFVKESFQAGAKDYILKHCLNKTEITKILEKYSKATNQSVTPKYNSHDHISEYLGTLLKGKYIHSSNTNIFHTLGLELSQENLLLIRLEIEDYAKFRQRNNQMGKHQYILKNICAIMQNILDRLCTGIVFYLQEDDAIFALLSDERFTDMLRLQNTCNLYEKQVISSLQLYFNIHCKCSFSPLCRNIRDIRFAYEDILKQNNLNLPKQEKHLTPIDIESIYNRGV